ncbi:hypothetical protein J3459_006697 [Metarhizium acridum]|uniref:uncharacterized protein n=1 Tax=Metarhizium acridum TaxID=92637 RepID=UPI001C6AE2BB|nr:hypothetical protein J3458_004918 [Metarhizium acridum]KAG8427432.1 hypothetical protein J3459_006697 [Metarhizium acridum]
MLKSLGYKAEALQRYYAVCLENADDVKEACFDIQIQLVGFLTSAVTCTKKRTRVCCFTAGSLLQTRNSPKRWRGLRRWLPYDPLGQVRAVALFGLGDIGKSSIVARYLERKFEDNEYGAVFWIHG